MERITKGRLEEISRRYISRSDVLSLGKRMDHMQIELIRTYMPEMDDETKARAVMTLDHLRRKVE